MKSFGWFAIGCFALISIVSCKNVERQNAEIKVNAYAKFVDSVQLLKTKTALKTWEGIQNQNDLKIRKIEIALSKITNKELIEKEFYESTIQFELFKSKILVQQEKLKLETTKIVQ